MDTGTEQSLVDGRTLVHDNSSAKQSPVENDGRGHQLEMKRGQKWTQRENAVGWEEERMMLYAKGGLELEKEIEGGKRRACHWLKGGEG